jgi:2-phospho-L-lactate guanylyltransferase
MTWTALIPLKGRGERKTRLAGRLNDARRRALSHELFGHVASVLNSSAGVSEVSVLSDLRPENWNGPLIFDEGRGLNIELRALVSKFGPRRLLVIHADLPLVSAEDISILLAEAEGGCAIAPDRHGSGTNAIALRDASGFGFSFGPDSFARHRAAFQGRVHVVIRRGLGLDIDTPGDLDAAIALGGSAEAAHVGGNSVRGA